MAVGFGKTSSFNWDILKYHVKNDSPSVSAELDGVDDDFEDILKMESYDKVQVLESDSNRGNYLFTYGRDEISHDQLLNVRVKIKGAEYTCRIQLKNYDPVSLLFFDGEKRKKINEIHITPLKKYITSRLQNQEVALAQFNTHAAEVNDVNRQPWFHGYIPELEARTRLDCERNGSVNGAFLVTRESEALNSKYFLFAQARELIGNGNTTGIRRFPICKTESGEFMLGNNKSVLRSSVSELIKAYRGGASANRIFQGEAREQSFTLSRSSVSAPERCIWFTVKDHNEMEIENLLTEDRQFTVCYHVEGKEINYETYSLYVRFQGKIQTFLINREQIESKYQYSVGCMSSSPKESLIELIESFRRTFFANNLEVDGQKFSLGKGTRLK